MNVPQLLYPNMCNSHLLCELLETAEDMPVLLTRVSSGLTQCLVPGNEKKPRISVEKNGLKKNVTGIGVNPFYKLTQWLSSYG